MSERPTVPIRSQQLVLAALLAGQMAFGVVAGVLVLTGRAPRLAAAAEHVVAYAWVAVTIAASLAAYVLAGGLSARPRRARPSRRLAIASLTDLATLAGIVAFLLVHVWPVLAIAAMVALLGLALAWPRAAPRALGDATEQEAPRVPD